MRLIPVHTGNTFTAAAVGVSVTAHPRAYGEYTPSFVLTLTTAGSSPCIRGIPISD